MTSCRNRLFVTILVLLAGLLPGCGSDQSRFGGNAGSAEELVRAALDYLEISDTASMNALRITRFEHDSLLVPAMPIGQAPNELVDLNMAYVMMERNNTKGLRRAIADYGDFRYEFVKVEFPEPPEQYGPFTVHRETVVTVRDTLGTEFVLPIFGSMVTDGRRFRLAAYID